MLLKEIVEKEYFAFHEGPLEWQDAIREACRPLEVQGVIESVYAEEIIACVEKHGPYIVLIPGVAMPHSTENAKGCNGTGIGFMRTDTPVSFDANDPEKDASIFFTLCSTNQEEHFANMQRLYAILTDEAVVEELKQATSADDLLRIDGLVDENKLSNDMA